MSGQWNVSNQWTVAQRYSLAAATWANDRETWLALLAAPAFLLPEYLAPLLAPSAALLVLLIGCRLALHRPLRLGGTLDAVVPLLLLLLPIGYLVSSDPQRSLPKLTCSLYGLFLLWSLAGGLPRRDLRPAALLLALSGMGLALLGLVGTDWPRSKVLYLAELYNNLPRMFADLSSATRGRFSPNEVAGALVLLTPLALAALIAVWRSPAEGWPAARRRAWLVALALTAPAMLVVMVLTQSRGALVALCAGLATMAVLRRPRLLAIGAAGAAAALVAFAVLQADRVAAVRDALAGAAPGLQGKLTALLSAAHLLALSGTGDTAGATGRVEMWSNAWRAIMDYPFTGSGLHTFPAVSWANYVYTGISPVWNMTHAHNAFLQVGVDLGVGGLLAYLALLAIVVWRGLRFVHSRPPALEAWLACGILGGVAGHMVHSLVDVAARPLGNKPGVIFWLMAGVLLAVDRSALPEHSRRGIRVAPLAVGLAVLAVVGAWSVTLGPLAPALRLNLGALALDQARLRPGVSAAERTALLDHADGLLQQALPWRADSVYVRLGATAAEQGDVVRARTWWARTPQALPFLMSRGNAAVALGDLAGAAMWYDHALALAPQSSNVLVGAASIATAQGRAGDALALLQKALALDAFDGGDAERSKAHLAVARLFAGQKAWSEAIAAYERAQALAPHVAAQREVAAALYLRDGDYEAAEAYLRRSIAQSPDQVEAYTGLMEVLWGDGRAADAVSLGQSTIRRFPEAVEPLLLLGRILFEQKRFVEAEDAFVQAVRLRPRSTDARIWLVRAVLEQGQTRRAIELLEEDIRSAPDQPVYFVWLGDVKRANGDAAGAADAYRRALAIDAGNSAARRGLESLP